MSCILSSYLQCILFIVNCKLNRHSFYNKLCQCFVTVIFNWKVEFLLNFEYIALKLYLLNMRSNCFNTTKNRNEWEVWKHQWPKKKKKKTDNDLHNTTEKTKDLARGIQQQSEMKCSEWVRRSCFTYYPFSLTVVNNLVVKSIKMKISVMWH